jgi:hypothetical protein
LAVNFDRPYLFQQHHRLEVLNETDGLVTAKAVDNDISLRPWASWRWYPGHRGCYAQPPWHRQLGDAYLVFCTEKQEELYEQHVQPVVWSVPADRAIDAKQCVCRVKKIHLDTWHSHSPLRGDADSDVWVLKRKLRQRASANAGRAIRLRLERDVLRAIMDIGAPAFSLAARSRTGHLDITGVRVV